MTYNEVIKISDTYFLPLISELYGLVGYEIKPVKSHVGGRNVVYNCEKEGAGAKILRISFLNDRSREDLLGEVEYIRYLYVRGGSVSDVVSSLKGNLLEEITHNNHTFFVCLFEKARGKMLVENNYRYREGVPISEYYYNCGKVLGKLHQLSKGYTPVHPRYSFFDKYNAEYIDKLIPGSLSLLKEKLLVLLKTLEGLDRNRESFGMVHFDYSDGNYMIDFDTGEITVFDFDNSCFCWYMYDLANLWTHGVGWIQFEQDSGKRKKFMDDYFETVLAGYRSETGIEDSMMDELPLFIQVTLMEGIVDAFEVMRNNGEEPECDEVLSYLIKCMEDDIPYMGFFHEIFSCEEPFEYGEERCGKDFIMEKGIIIFLNGVSSSGKTTLAKVLQSKLSEPYYHICCDDFMNMTPKHILNDDFGNQLRITQGIMHETIALFSDKGYNVIIDDVVLDLPEENDWLYDYVKMFENYPILFVRVDCPIEELERREIKRGDRHIGMARWQQEHMDNGVIYDVVANTYENTMEECAERILSVLSIQSDWVALKANKRYFERKRNA